MIMMAVLDEKEEKLDAGRDQKPSCAALNGKQRGAVADVTWNTQTQTQTQTQTSIESFDKILKSRTDQHPGSQLRSMCGAVQCRMHHAPRLCRRVECYLTGRLGGVWYRPVVQLMETGQGVR
jgi:hypothetical protein